MKKWISCILVMVMTISIFGTLPANAENGSLEPNSQMETDISMQGTNSFGNILTNELTAEMDKQEENNWCNIFSIEMNGTDATVSFETTENCTLVVAVYDESGEQMLASGNTAVVKGETEALVTIDTDSMPQYYYLRGFLVDSDTLRPVCTVYESPNYTQEMQAFFAKTVNDFDSEKVLNLDESESNNFAVFSNETIIIEQNGTTNRVTKADDSTRTYVIANADNTVKSLKNGDVFTCKNSDETLIVKVDNISVSGSTVTINSQDTSAEEVFDYVKIDTTVQNAEISQKRSSVQSNDLYTDKEPKIYGAGISKEIKPSCTKSVEFSTPEISQYFTVGVSGGIEMTVSAPIKFYYNFKSLKEQYLYTEFKIEYVSKIFAAIDGEAKLPIDLGEFQSQLVYSPHDYGPLVYDQSWFYDGFTQETLINDCWYDNWFLIQDTGMAPLFMGEWGGFMDGDRNEAWMVYLRDFMIEHRIHHTFWCFNENSGDTGGLVYDNFGKWDEEKYALVEPSLWKDNNGKFISLDHSIALGVNGISLSEYYGGTITPPVKKIAAGDVTEDGKINILDLSLAKYKLCNEDRPTALYASPEDTNGDGTFNVKDILHLAKYIVGIKVELKTYSQ